MIYKNTFELRGTETQIAIVKAALDRIYFPWEKLSPPAGKFVIGWMNLNGQSLEGEKPTEAKKHSGTHPKEGDGHEPILGSLNGKKYTLGVFYPTTGNIFIDNLLVDYVRYAETTVSAEIAHLVDFFLPLTDEMKEKIITVMHGGVNQEHGHSWWEKEDYGSEYYTLVGEGFMQAFTVAYSDVPFDGANDFVHTLKPENAYEVRRIIGLERTDLIVEPEEPATVTPKPEPEVVPDPIVEPAPEPEVVPTPEPVVTPTPVPEPEKAPEPIPVPEPPKPAPHGDDEVHYEVFPHSKVYHRLGHYTRRDGRYTSDVTGLRPCKVCKP